MKIKIVTVISLLVLASGWYFFRIGVEPQDEPGSVPDPEVERPLAKQEQDLPAPKNRALELQPTDEEVKVMFETPVEFYGQVLDQNDNPVIGAEVRCSWPLMGTRESPIKVQSSAPKGRFEILDPRGKIVVSISVDPPPGYRELGSEESMKVIQIAEPPERIMQIPEYSMLSPQLKQLLMISDAYQPGKTKPIIFRLERL